MNLWWILFIAFWLGIVFFAWVICRAGAFADKKTGEMLKEAFPEDWWKNKREPT